MFGRLQVSTKYVSRSRLVTKKVNNISPMKLQDLLNGRVEKPSVFFFWVLLLFFPYLPKSQPNIWAVNKPYYILFWWLVYKIRILSTPIWLDRIFNPYINPTPPRLFFFGFCICLRPPASQQKVSWWQEGFVWSNLFFCNRFGKLMLGEVWWLIWMIGWMSWLFMVKKDGKCWNMLSELINVKPW